MNRIFLCSLLAALPFAASPSQETVTKVKSPAPWLEVNGGTINYGASPLQRAATGAQKSVVESILKDVLGFRKELEAEGDEVQPAVWQVDATFRTQAKSPALISWMLEGMSTTGGAHPRHHLQGQIWTLYKGKPTRAQFATLFNKEGYMAIEMMARQEVNRQKTAQMMGPGETSPIPVSALGQMIATKKGITFLFEHYVVASYAEGAFEAFISWQDLRPYLTDFGRHVGQAAQKG